MTDRPGDADPVEPDGLDELEEALRWEGDEARGVAAPRSRRSRQRAAEPELDDEDVEPIDRDGEPLDGVPLPTSPARSAATVLFAVLYLLVTVGWVLSVQRTSSGSGSLFVEISWQFGEFMAMAGGVLAFGTVLTLARRRPLRVAVLGWMIGVLLLIPWPIILFLLGQRA